MGGLLYIMVNSFEIGQQFTCWSSDKSFKGTIKISDRKEAYEQAAVLRDKIKELEKKASRRVGVGKYDWKKLLLDRRVVGQKQ